MEILVVHAWAKDEQKLEQLRNALEDELNVTDMSSDQLWMSGLVPKDSDRWKRIRTIIGDWHAGLATSRCRVDHCFVAAPVLD